MLHPLDGSDLHRLEVVEPHRAGVRDVEDAPLQDRHALGPHKGQGVDHLLLVVVGVEVEAAHVRDVIPVGGDLDEPIVRDHGRHRRPHVLCIEAELVQYEVLGEEITGVEIACHLVGRWGHA